MKVAIVTGASSGIGLNTVIELAKNEYQVIALMRPTSDHTQLDKRLRELSLINDVEQIKLNLENVQEVQHTIDYITNKYKHIDVLINNAGYAQGGLVELVEYEAWNRQFQSNVWITINLCKAVAPIMRRQRVGKIVNMGSISGQIALPAFGPYAMSKYAIAGFSESLRLELLPFNVYVVLIEAGSYQTAIWDKGFSMMPTNTIDDYDQINQKMIQLTKKSAATNRQSIELVHFIMHILKKRKPSFKQIPTYDVKVILYLKSLLGYTLYEKLINVCLLKFNKR